MMEGLKRWGLFSAVFTLLGWMALGGAVLPVAAQDSDSPLAMPTNRAGKLKDPGPAEIERIIREFAAKEKLFREARENYSYHQINKVQELDVEGRAVGTFEQSWDILFDDQGRRIEYVTYAPLSTLKRIGITQEDYASMRNIQPFVLTTDELPDYEVRYLSHTYVDELTAYAFSIRPKVIERGKQYFQGTVWVDDRDLQIVKSQGKPVGELYSKKKRKKKNENLFPISTTYREQIDGKFWFPTFTKAEDTLYFSSGPVRVRQITRYTDYRQFKSTVKITVIGEVAPDSEKEK